MPTDVPQGMLHAPESAHELRDVIERMQAELMLEEITNAAGNPARASFRKQWLFVGSQHGGERAAAVLNLIESAKLNGHDPWALLKDVFDGLPTLKNCAVAELLPHNWRPRSANLSTPRSAP